MVLQLMLWLYRKLSFLLLGEELSKTLRSFRNSIGTVIEIDDALPKFLKARMDDCPKFWVQTHWQKRKGWRPNDQIFFDAHYSFILWTRKGSEEFAVASIAFDPFGFSGICIRQIQGKQGYGKYLGSIKWERLLIAVVHRWARAQNIRNIHIISARLSDYYNYERHGSMYLRYDVTARRMGLKLNPLTQIYGSRTSRLKLATP